MTRIYVPDGEEYLMLLEWIGDHWAGQSNSSPFTFAFWFENYPI